MGIQEITTAEGGPGDRRAMQRVLRDLEAMERMLDEGMFETDRQRIGAEQEMVLVDDAYQPASVATDVLDRLDDDRIVPEIARFNLEFNCDPIDLRADCLSSLRRQVEELYTKVKAAANEIGASPLLSGICPTVDLPHLTTANIMPRQRYYALDEALKKLRGADYELHIDGADELIVRHPSVMLESVNTSFQVHFQTTPDEFPAHYNTSLATAAPSLAIAVNSPILFGKRLWRETRIAIFQQVVDTRSEGAGHRDLLGRVRFGEAWVRESVLEILRSDVTRFRQILHAETDSPPDPIEQLDQGIVPKLKAWQTFNSSVYRWMRPCYGLTDGKPHLRIENRVLPAGPTIEDEVASSAFWIGLMIEGPHAWPDITERLELRDARSNFLRAARDGLSAHMTWTDGEDHPIRELILEEFIPVAKQGLERKGLDQSDIDANMNLLTERVESKSTGAHWALHSIARMRGAGTRSQRLACLTRAMLDNQDAGKPVHEWPEAQLDEQATPAQAFARVSQCMTTDLFTVSKDECIDLVASIMDWERLRHIPVEDSDHKLVGLVSYRILLRTLAKRKPTDPEDEIAVSDIMITDPVTVSPDTPTLDAIRIMCENRVACLPVVEDGRLVGIISDRDYTEIARRLLERALRQERV